MLFAYYGKTHDQLIKSTIEERIQELLPMEVSQAIGRANYELTKHDESLVIID